MEEMNDEQIQAMLDSGLNLPRDISASGKKQFDSYQALFKNLKTEPERGLPFDFSSKVSTRLKIKLKRRADLMFNLLAALGIIFGLFAAYVMLTLIDATNANQLLLAAIKFKWVLIMASVLLLGTLVFDQRVAEERY